MQRHLTHRGLAKKQLNENTIPAFKYSFSKKYGIETDLHATKDNKLVCFHDFSLKRKFRINKKIKDTVYSEIKRISKKSKAEIPLLKSLLKIKNSLIIYS